MSFQEAFKLYEDGKHRRYELLFAVNGGAFAIAKLIGENRLHIGNLGLPQLAAGMILFTIVMVIDIYKFGAKLHRLGRKIETRKGYELFGLPGKLVLIAIGLLLCVGWILAAGWFWTQQASSTPNVSEGTW